MDQSLTVMKKWKKGIYQYSLLAKTCITGDLTAHFIDHTELDPYLDSDDNVNNDQLFANDIPLRVNCNHVVDIMGVNLSRFVNLGIT